MISGRTAARCLVLLAAVAILATGAGPTFAQGTLSALQTDVDLIASRARPSLVTVYARRTALQNRGRGGLPEPRLHTRVGSGVAVDESSILTTASVVMAAERVFVETANGLQVEAQVAGLDLVFNVALLRVPDLRLPSLRFADERAAQIGDWVIALGTTYRAQPTQSVGNVAYRHREPCFTLLQLTNTVYPGNSGGAALNTRGELVGIVLGDLGSPEVNAGASGIERRPGGMSFALPVEMIRPVYESLRRYGRVPHGFLGVSTRGEVVKSETDGEPVPLGARVESAAPGGPAEHAGLRRGDLIVAFDRVRVEYPEQLARWVAATRPGSVVELVWVRGDLQQTGKVTLGVSGESLPGWALNSSAPQAAPGAPRIAEIERQIQRLNRQLELLKNQGASAPH